MIVSFDSKAYYLSSIYETNYGRNKFKQNKLLKFLGQGQGPQEFTSELIRKIKTKKMALVTNNFLISDLHIINSGNYSFLWKYFQIKNKNRLIIRLDGVGIDSEYNNSLNPKNSNIFKLCIKANHAIFQSKFCKECFENIYQYYPNSTVIYNGTNLISNLSNDLPPSISEAINSCKNGYFVVAGRNVSRKRILETIQNYALFKKDWIPKLIVLSNLHKYDLPTDKKIIYLGIQPPSIARNIIANSIGLIHMDRYDWCPNIVVNAIFDKVPVICSNFGGTKEIVDSNGIIVKEFPEDLPSNLEGIKIAKSSHFPEKQFKEAIDKLYSSPPIIQNNKKLFIENTATEYIKVCKRLLLSQN